MASRKLTDEFGGFDVIVDGRSIAMQVEELTLPPIERMTQNSRPGGAVGAIKSQHGIVDDFKVILKLRGYSTDLDTIGAARGIDAVTIIARAAYTDRQDGGTFTNEITMRGRVNKWERHGTLKQGDQTEASFELDLVFYDERRGGAEIAFIDINNSRFRIGGIDQAPGHTALFG